MTNLSNFFNVEDVENVTFKVDKNKNVQTLEAEPKKTYSVITSKSSKQEIAEFYKNNRLIEEKARLEAIEEIKSVSKKGNMVLDILLDQMQSDITMDYTERNIDPKTIQAASSLINAIANANGKLLDDGKKRIEKLVQNTQNNVTVSNNEKIKQPEEVKLLTTEDILKAISKNEEPIEGEYTENE